MLEILLGTGFIVLVVLAIWNTIEPPDNNKK